MSVKFISLILNNTGDITPASRKVRVQYIPMFFQDDGMLRWGSVFFDRLARLDKATIALSYPTPAGDRKPCEANL
jgi:hypothetical protein